MGTDLAWIKVPRTGVTAEKLAKTGSVERATGAPRHLVYYPHAIIYDELSRSRYNRWIIFLLGCAAATFWVPPLHPDPATLGESCAAPSFRSGNEVHSGSHDSRGSSVSTPVTVRGPGS